MNGYWRDKIVDFSKINIPTYTTVGWCHFHSRGAMNGFRKIATKQKWLRCHRDFEWPDSYKRENLMDLQAFFDRFLKDIHNGWEETSPIRMDVMDAYDFDYQVARNENEFPLARTQYRKLFLDSLNASMSFEEPTIPAEISYESASSEACFDYQFTQDTEITGYMKLRLWVETDTANDMDLFVNVQKLDREGRFIPTNVLSEPHPGAWGKMRVSHRKLDEKLTTNFQPVQAHLSEEKIAPGEVVGVDIEIWPTSRIWHINEMIRVQIAGRYIRKDGWFENLAWETHNMGKHIIHTGGSYDSFLQIPIIPPKYKAGDYLYR